jgi:cytoskeletal protein CcmA (bactofilin family)
MALFGKDRERSDRPRGLGPESPVPPREPAPREVEMFERDRDKTQVTDDASGASAFLGKGSRVSGKLSFEGTVRIEGHVEGEILAQDTLTIGDTAVINAQVHGTSIVVHGKITGDITARKRLEIRAPGKVFGNISTPSLVIHDGVVFEGQCTMSSVEPARVEKDRKVAFFPKDERPGDGVALKASELAK